MTKEKHKSKTNKHKVGLIEIINSAAYQISFQGKEKGINHKTTWAFIRSIDKFYALSESKGSCMRLSESNTTGRTNHIH